MRAIDNAGNADQTPASFAWSVDTTAPTTQIDTHPLAISSSADASFAFSADDGSGSGVASFQCRRDSAEVADWEPCSSPKAYKALAEGAHTFEVRAIDAAGNADATPASYSWGIDTKAPTTQIDSNPAALSASANAEFAFSGADAGGSGLASLQCRLDSSSPADWQACTSPKTYTGLSDGAHTFEVRALDQAGNADQTPASFAWSVNTTAPTTQIDSNPAALSASANAEFTFSGADAGGSGLASLQCRLDSTAPGSWATCTSPQDLHLPRRRRPQLRGPRDRQSRQRRPDPRQLRLERRHHRPAGRDRLRPRRPDQRRDADLRLPPRRGGGHRAVLDRPGHPGLRPLLRRRLPHALLAAQ